MHGGNVYLRLAGQTLRPIIAFIHFNDDLIVIVDVIFHIWFVNRSGGPLRWSDEFRTFGGTCVLRTQRSDFFGSPQRSELTPHYFPGIERHLNHLWRSVMKIFYFLACCMHYKCIFDKFVFHDYVTYSRVVQYYILLHMALRIVPSSALLSKS